MRDAYFARCKRINSGVASKNRNSDRKVNLRGKFRAARIIGQYNKLLRAPRRTHKSFCRVEDIHSTPGELETRQKVPDFGAGFADSGFVSVPSLIELVRQI